MLRAIYFTTFLLAFLIGVVWFWFDKNPAVPAGFLGLIFFGLIVFAPKLSKLVLIVVFGLVLSYLRIYFIESSVAPNKIEFYNEQNVIFHAKVNEEVERRVDKQKITLEAEEIFLDNSWRKVSGRILLTANLYPEFFYGDFLLIAGTLKKPEPFSYENDGGQEVEFKYDNYLSRYQIFSLIYYPEEIKILARFQGNIILQKLFNFKRLLIGRVNELLPEPQASFLGGLLWGARSGLPPDLLEGFNRTGTTHIIALSGFNITIIGVLLFLLAPWVYLKRQQAYWLVLATIVLFVLFTGGQASVMRAAVMGILALTAYYLGRPKAIFVLLVFAAGFMVILNPLVLFYDVGFQLSFLATIGLIYLAPNWEKKFLWLPKKFALRESVVATLSAIFMTMPLIAYEFGRVSLVAPVTNIFILPAIPGIMLVGFLAILISLVSFTAGQWIAYAVWFFLSYVINIVKFTASFSWAQIFVSISDSRLVAGIYFLIFFYLIYLERFSLKKIFKKI